MARRRRSGLVREPSALGGDLDAVHTKVRAKLQDEVHLFCPFPFTPMEMVKGCVAPEIIDVLTKAKTYKDGYDSGHGYIEFYPRMTLQVDFDSCNMLVPKKEYIKPADTMKPALNQWGAQVTEIYKKWMLVDNVASWLDKRATMGAIRYYWPSMMALLPNDSSRLRELHGAGMERFKEPVGISSILHIIRETAMTVAAGQMMPPAPQVPYNRTSVRISIRGTDFTHYDEQGNQHHVTGMGTELTW